MVVSIVTKNLLSFVEIKIFSFSILIHTSQLNSYTERNNRTIIEKATEILINSKFNIKFWPDTVDTVVYILNRCSVNDNLVTPAEKFQMLGRIKIFGSLVYRHISNQFRRKFFHKSEKYIFNRYSTPRYKLWN